MLIASCLFIGCTTPHAVNVPTTPWSSPREAVDIIAARARAASTMTARADLTLADSERDAVRLEAAVAADRDKGVRMRAWKLGTAVFDMTSLPSGTWLWTSDRIDPATFPLTASESGVRDKGLHQAFFIATGGMFIELADTELPPVTHDEPRGTMTIHFTVETIAIDCIVDRRTLTVIAYVFAGPDEQHARIDLSRYVMLGDQPFPLRWRIAAKQYAIDAVFDDVVLGEPLPAGALRPPSRAVKLP